MSDYICGRCNCEPCRCPRPERLGDLSAAKKRETMTEPKRDEMLCKDCGEPFIGHDCRCVRRMQEAAKKPTEPKRDEAMELAKLIGGELGNWHVLKADTLPFKPEVYGYIASLIRPHLAHRPVESAIVDAWWHVVQQDSHTIIEWFGVPGGRIYSMRRPRDAFEQVVFVPEQPK